MLLAEEVCGLPGDVVSAQGLQVDPKKTKCVSKWLTLQNPKELKKFLGVASFYRRFVPNFAHIAGPLYQLTEKQRCWSWTRECEEAFNSLKAKLASAPILTFPQFHLPFTIDCDASIGLGHSSFPTLPLLKEVQSSNRSQLIEVTAELPGT